jgi:hypothetical protein
MLLRNGLWSSIIHDSHDIIKNCWPFVQVGYFFCQSAMFWFVQIRLRGKITGYAEFGFGIAVFKYFFQHGVIAERRFNKQLCLIELNRPVASSSFIFLAAQHLINRQIAMKSKALAVKTEAISASKIELGPTSGTTFIPMRWALSTISAPGSAMPGQPASLIKPTSLPACRPLKKSAYPCRGYVYYNHESQFALRGF